jgi:hypothetical protein
MASRAIALTSLVALSFFFLRAMTQPLCNAAMPYEISFRRFVEVPDPEIYINECCWGGDVVQQQLLPLVTAEYTDVMAEQEDWGWFIWFKKGDLNLAIDIHTDSREGEFRIHVSANRVRFFGLSRRPADDTPEVEALVEKITGHLRRWGAEAVTVEKMDQNFS